MNLLIDGAPKEVWVAGKPYGIRWEYEYSILYELLMLDDSLTIREKVDEALQLYFPVIPEDREQAAEAALWFYQCGKEEGKKQKRKSGKGKTQRIYSFDYDDSYIYAAFLEQYKIDLVDTRNLHWWKFKALFHGLDAECEFRKIMGYRAMVITREMSKEQKQFYKEMKEIYRIPLARDEDEKANVIQEALLNGGDLSNVL